MLGRDYGNQNCSAARTLELVGERWSLLILRDALFKEFARFGEFERSLGIAPNVLQKRLASFVENGIMRVDDSGAAGSHPRYVLTEKGLGFKSVVAALTEWGDRWVCPGPVDFVDNSTGEIVELRFVRVDQGDAVEAAGIGVRRRS
jgi:DNA-binding HxlR family transcriptional regulator